MVPRSLTSCALVALLLAGCPSPTANDAGDVAHPDASDGHSDGDAGIDAQMCPGPMPLDLAMLATMTANGLDYVGDNTTTPEGYEDTLQPATASCQFRVVHEQVFHYTMRTTAALRVSTDNPNSDPGFDSVLFITRDPCTLPAPTLACNDDDPFAPANPHVTLSLATTPVLSAGTGVLIAVGGFYPVPGSTQSSNPMGETGAYELTVQEVTPLAPNAACDPTGQSNVCPSGSTCIADVLAGDTFSCHPDGATPGAACNPDGTCAAALQCDSQAFRCYAVGMEGAMCDAVDTPRLRCADGFTCVVPVRAEAHGVCHANGTVPLANCDMSNNCVAGLVCKQNPGRASTCARLIPPGGACDTFDSLCSMGQSCVIVGGGASVGNCTDNGTVQGSACRPDVPECDGTLACITGFLDRTCKTVGRNPGDPCGPFGVCSFDWTCTALDPRTPYQEVCLPSGTQGGVCNASGLACNNGLTCTNNANRAAGRCVQIVPSGGMCDLFGRQSQCANGSSCVSSDVTAATGTCVPLGSAAGAACRATVSMQCDTGLACSASTGGICQQSAGSAGACVPRFASVACPSGQACVATSLTAGSCAAPSTETEPNEAVPAAPVSSLPAAFSGELTRFDVDCYGIDVGASGAVFAMVSGPTGTCPGTLALDLCGPDGHLIGADGGNGALGCPCIDGHDPTYGWAGGLAAGRYSVCVRENSDRHEIPAYVLSLGD